MTIKDLKVGQKVDKKEKKEIVKSTKTTIEYLVPSYKGNMKDKNLTFQGAVNVITVAETDVGLAFLAKTMTLKDLADLNRQRITDGKNGIRTEEDMEVLLQSYVNGTASDSDRKKVVAYAMKGGYGDEIKAQFDAVLAGIILK